MRICALLGAPVIVVYIPLLRTFGEKTGLSFERLNRLYTVDHTHMFNVSETAYVLLAERDSNIMTCCEHLQVLRCI